MSMDFGRRTLLRGMLGGGAVTRRPALPRLFPQYQRHRAGRRAGRCRSASALGSGAAA